MAKYNDSYTVKLKTVDYLNSYGREDITIHNLVLNLNAREQNVIQKILNMLNSDIDYSSIIGYENYRFMINCNITELSKILEVDRTVLSKALKILGQHNLVKWDKAFKHLLYINSFLYNIHNKFDTRVLNIFGIQYK